MANGAVGLTVVASNEQYLRALLVVVAVTFGAIAYRVPVAVLLCVSFSGGFWMLLLLADWDGDEGYALLYLVAGVGLSLIATAVASFVRVFVWTNEGRPK